MRRHLVRWGIVAALVVAAGALPGGGPQRIDLRDVSEAVTLFKVAEVDDGTAEPRS
ncbi:hypothetical protein [Thermomonospora umbrina]|uniref:Uncharacterized protein n=1 Tax=Thermomonospora umbrina TaxID=111806 RepID=A0A3D9SR85_9ACTN|nr:hypothetical protein [Thermomonospora umbrina]REE97020.1 hypothetical protein DFJ69_2475 [Thermomonospora umbrina]